MGYRRSDVESTANYPDDWSWTRRMWYHSTHNGTYEADAVRPPDITRSILLSQAMYDKLGCADCRSRQACSIPGPFFLQSAVVHFILSVHCFTADVCIQFIVYE